MAKQYTYDPKTDKWKTKFNPENYKAKNFSEEVIDAKTGKIVVKIGDKINFLNAKKLANDGLKDILVSKESLFGKFLHEDVKINDEEDGVFKIGTELVAAVAVGTIIGFILDTWFGTKPWLIIIFFFIGSAAGMLNVIRTAKRMQDKESN